MRSPIRFSDRLKPLFGGAYPASSIRIGFVVALLGAFCCAKSVEALPNAPVTAPAPMTADAFRNLRLDMRRIVSSRGVASHRNRSGWDQDRGDRARRQHGARPAARRHAAR